MGPKTAWVPKGWLPQPDQFEDIVFLSVVGLCLYFPRGDGYIIGFRQHFYHKFFLTGIFICIRGDGELRLRFQS